MTMAEEAIAWLNEISANNPPADSSPAKSVEKELDIFDFDSPFIFEPPEKALEMSPIEEAMAWFEQENAKIHAREAAEKARQKKLAAEKAAEERRLAEEKAAAEQELAARDEVRRPEAEQQAKEKLARERAEQNRRKQQEREEREQNKKKSRGMDI